MIVHTQVLMLPLIRAVSGTSGVRCVSRSRSAAVNAEATPTRQVYAAGMAVAGGTTSAPVPIRTRVLALRAFGGGDDGKDTVAEDHERVVALAQHQQPGIDGRQGE